MKKNCDDRSWIFLISSPTYSGPIFDESVVLVLEDSKAGSFGVIINKPIEKTLSEIDQKFECFKNLSKVEVFDGGPLAKDRISIAIWKDDNSEIGSFSFGISPEKAEIFLRENPSAHAAAYLGYSGWSEGQLEDEINEGSWIAADVNLEIFDETEIDELWEKLVFESNPIYAHFPNLPKSDSELN